MKDRDVIVLKKIVQYAEEINGTIVRFEPDFNKFKSDYVLKNAVAMCVLQIGELAGKLTDELTLKYHEMPWRNIISVRNRVAHTYENIDVEILWGIAVKNIPELKAYCENILKEINE